MFFLLPVGHDETSVRRVPWVTVGIIFACLALHVHTTIVNGQLEREIDRAAQQQSWHTKVLLEAVAHENLDLSDFEAVDDRPGLASDDSRDDVHQLLGLLNDRPGYELDSDYSNPERGPPAVPREELEKAVKQAEAFRAEIAEILSRSPAIMLGYAPATDGPIKMATSIFMHGGWLHFLGNILFLYLVGCNVEDRWGRAAYAGFYLVGGMIAALAYALWHPDTHVPLIGASGAIAAVMGAFLVAFARTRIVFFYAMFLFRIKAGTFRAPAYLVLPLWFGLQALNSLFEIDSNATVAYSAHVGGFAFGFGVALIMRLSGLDSKLYARGPGNELVFSEEPTYVEAMACLGNDDEPGALEKLRETVAKAPQHADAHSHIVRLGIKLRDPDAIATSLPSVLQRLRVKEGDTSVVEMYEDIREELPKFQLDARSLSRVVESAHAADRGMIVVQATRELIRHHPNDEAVVRALWLTALGQHKLARPDLARKTLNKITAGYPMSPFSGEAKRMLERLEHPEDSDEIDAPQLSDAPRPASGDS